MTPAQAQEFSFAPARQPQRSEMNDDYLQLPIGDEAPEIVTAVSCPLGLVRISEGARGCAERRDDHVPVRA